MVYWTRHVINANIWFVFLRVLCEINTGKWEDVKKVVGCLSGVAWSVAVSAIGIVLLFVLNGGRSVCASYFFKLYPVVAIGLEEVYRSARIIRCGGTKIDGTPPTAQTPGPNSLKLFAEAPQEDTFRGIGGIFEFHPRSQDNELFVAHFRVFLDPPKGSKMSTNAPIFQLLRRNSKIPPMPLKVSS